MDGAPVALVEGGVVYYVRTDHIGRPVFATDGSGANVWEATYLPFGGMLATWGSFSIPGVPPPPPGQPPALQLRFPGQWFQAESGLHQNWMRDYDPTTGRYMQADPLGLVDGASVYGCARQNPLRYVDPRGEDSQGYLERLGAIAAYDLATTEPTDAMWPKYVGYACATVAALVLDGLTSEACGCDDDCPSPKEARAIASSIAHSLKRTIQASGVGGANGRSGGHGRAYSMAGAQMIRDAKRQTCPSLRRACQIVGRQFIQRGKSINHP